MERPKEWGPVDGVDRGKPPSVEPGGLPIIEELPVLAYAALLRESRWRPMHLIKPDGTRLRGFYIDGMEPMTMYVVRGATFNA